MFMEKKKNKVSKSMCYTTFNAFQYTSISRHVSKSSVYVSTSNETSLIYTQLEIVDMNKRLVAELFIFHI